MKKNSINWNDVHKRMDAVKAAVEQGFKPGREGRDSILRSRAKALARKAEDVGTEEAFEVVEFLLAHEKYAVASGYVREIYPLLELTPIPCAPRFVLGIINVRGQIISVIDIKKFFDLPEKGITDLNKVIILHSGEMEFGILADSILGVRNVRQSELEMSLPTLTGVREEYLMGVTKDREVILDAGKLLSDKKIVVQENVEI